MRRDSRVASPAFSPAAGGRPFDRPVFAAASKTNSCVSCAKTPARNILGRKLSDPFSAPDPERPAAGIPVNLSRGRTCDIRSLRETMTMRLATNARRTTCRQRAKTLCRASSNDAPLRACRLATGPFRRQSRRRGPIASRATHGHKRNMAQNCPKTRRRTSRGRHSTRFLLKRVCGFQQAPHTGTALIALKTKDSVNQYRARRTACDSSASMAC